MIESTMQVGPVGHTVDTRVGTTVLAGLVDTVRRLGPAVDDAERVDRIRLLEELKSAAAAVQARVAVDLAASQRAAAGPTADPDQVDRSTASQLGLAKRESPARARRWLGFARIALAELPGTFAALEAGATTEWRAMLVARETAWLCKEHRLAVDAQVATHLGGWGDRRTEVETRRRAQRLDPAGAVAHTNRSAADRRVSIRPAPATMVRLSRDPPMAAVASGTRRVRRQGGVPRAGRWPVEVRQRSRRARMGTRSRRRVGGSRLSALLPLVDGVACHQALLAAAADARASGDTRTRGQVMADTLTARLTGRATGDPVGVRLSLVMTDTALLAHRDTRGADEPAIVTGVGPVPAGIARRLFADACAHARATIRRLYSDGARLVAMETTARTAPAALADFIDVRDQLCRTPWCDAPIAHRDHAIPHAHGGTTTAANLQGLCEACNYTKARPGWTHRPDPAFGAGHLVTLTTPTGHTYTSRPPPTPAA